MGVKTWPGGGGAPAVPPYTSLLWSYITSSKVSSAAFWLYKKNKMSITKKKKAQRKWTFFFFWCTEKGRHETVWPESTLRGPCTASLPGITPEDSRALLSLHNIINQVHGIILTLCKYSYRKALVQLVQMYGTAYTYIMQTIQASRTSCKLRDLLYRRYLQLVTTLGQLSTP